MSSLLEHVQDVREISLEYVNTAILIAKDAFSRDNGSEG